MSSEHTSIQSRPLLIAIDGPVGAGKSSISDEVARRLGILRLDTGSAVRRYRLLLDTGSAIVPVRIFLDRGDRISEAGI
jgi:cytidylate kinase